MEHDGIDAMRIEVGVVPLFTKGEKAGKPNYKKVTDRRKLYITNDEAERWLTEHPDYCRECGNTGEVFVRWSADDGTTTRTCTSCEGAVRPVPFPDADGEVAASEQPGFFPEASS